MKLRGVQMRLTIWYMILLAIILAVFNAVVYFSLQYNLNERANADVQRRAIQAARATSQFGDTIYLDPDKLPTDLGGNVVFVVNSGGQPIQNFPQVKLGAPPPPPPPAVSAVQEGKPKPGQAVTPQGKVVYAVETVKNADGVIIGGIVVAKSLAQTEDTLRRLTLLLLAGSALALLLAFGCGQFLAWLSLRPVRRAFQRQRDFVADASHELRTPLALIRANTEAMLRRTKSLPTEAKGYANEVLEEVDYLNRIVGDLGTLALADSQQQRLQREPMELLDVLRDLLRQMHPLAVERGVTLAGQLEGSATVEGDAGRLRQLFLILLDNAVTYTPAGGRVSLKVQRFDHRVEVQVADTGAGIPEKDLPHIWERFYRVDKARTRQGSAGTGLGLAIARWIALAHNGSIRLESRRGEGTTAVVGLPAVPAPDARHQPAPAPIA
jgi:signal transduction histidine kinase